MGERFAGALLVFTTVGQYWSAPIARGAASAWCLPACAEAVLALHRCLTARWGRSGGRPGATARQDPRSTDGTCGPGSRVAPRAAALRFGRACGVEGGRAGHPLGRASGSGRGNVSATPHLRKTGCDLRFWLRRWAFARSCYLRNSAESALIVRRCGDGRSSMEAISADVSPGRRAVCGVAEMRR